jgi:hypothetical protein
VTVWQDLCFGCQQLQLYMEYGGTKPKESIRHDIWNESPVTTLICLCSLRMLSGGRICESFALGLTRPQVETTSQSFENFLAVSFRERQLAVGGASLASGCTRDALAIPR